MELAPQTYNAQQHRDDDEHDAAFVADLQRRGDRGGVDAAERHAFMIHELLIGHRGARGGDANLQRGLRFAARRYIHVDKTGGDDLH